MPRRGEIWWVSLDPTLSSEIAKTRPCLVLSANILNDRRRSIVVVPLSSAAQPNPPVVVSVECAGRRVVAVTDQIRAVAKERLRERLAVASSSDLVAVEAALRRILELS